MDIVFNVFFFFSYKYILCELLNTLSQISDKKAKNFMR